MSINFKDLLKIKTIECDGYVRYFIYLDCNGIKDKDLIVKLYTELYNFVIINKIQVIYEKIFGYLSFRDILDKIKVDFIGGHVITSYIQGEPILDGILSSVFLYGIHIINQNTIKTKYCSFKNKNIGTQIITNDIHHLYLSDIDGNSYLEDGECEYRNLYQNLEKYLSQNNFNPDNVVRTWIYMKDVLSDYKKFNDARIEFFEKNKIDFSIHSNTLPSSTCIGGSSCEFRDIHLDLYCVKSNDNKQITSRIYNKMQKEPAGSNYLFNPTFARGTAVITKDYIEIQISGTASIDSNGNTIYHNDPYNQIKTTFLNVKEILGQYGLDFSDICQSTCFFKDKNYYSDYLKVKEEFGLENTNFTFVENHVCRDNLLFEFDGFAVKKQDNRG